MQVDDDVRTVIASEVATDLLHPEFGSIYQKPDGEAYLSYLAGVTEGLANATRSVKQMSTATPVKKALKKDVDASSDDTVLPVNPDHFEFYHVERPPAQPMTKNETIATVVIGVVIAGTLGTLSYFGWKAEKERQAKAEADHQERMAQFAANRKERQEWFDTQRAEGRIVIETVDGEYMAIPNEAYQKSEIRKKVM